jgi:hypothetical protein
LGDELIVRIESVNLARRQLLFRLEKVTHQAEPVEWKRRKKADDGKFKSKGKPKGQKKRRR